MSTDDDDKKVKDIIGETSLADLQRWFGLPSFTELADEGKRAEVPAEDPYKEVRERRERALSAVEPWFLDGVLRRSESWWGFIKFKAVIDVVVDVDMPLFDSTMAEGLRNVAEPREIERPEVIEDQLKERTPQALLRDLHRVESTFDKTYEIYDSAAAEELDAVAQVRAAMSTSVKLPPLGDPPGTELSRLFADVRAERARPWADLPKRNRMANRRVTE